MPTDPAPRFAVIIPACDEEPCLGAVLAELRAALAGQPHLIAVGVNGSTDRTAAIARAHHGVLVAETSARGYGHGCRAAVSATSAPWARATSAVRSVEPFTPTARR